LYKDKKLAVESEQSFSRTLTKNMAFLSVKYFHKIHQYLD